MSDRAPTLLVVEDSRDQAVLIGLAARRARPGLDVRIVDGGIDGILYIEGKPPYDDRMANPLPDLVILDLIMPEVDGFKVLKRLKDRPDPIKVPVVVLTSSPNADAETRSRSLGAEAFFRKPADIDQLGDVVKEIIHEWIGSSRMIGAHIWAAG